MRDELREAILKCMVKTGHVETLKDLIQKEGAQISWDYSETWSIFAWVVHEQRSDIAKLMLAKGKLDVNAAEEEGKSPLHIAANAGNLEMVKHLLKLGAKTDAVSCYKETPVDVARRNGYTEIVAALTQSEQQFIMFSDHPVQSGRNIVTPTSSPEADKKARLQKSRE